MIISTLFDKVQHLVEDNSTTILTGIGVAGTITTAVLTGKASFKAARIISERTVALELDDEDAPDMSEKVKLVWPQYIPAVGVGGLTIAAIVLSNRLSAKETAAMAAAYSMSDKTFQEYKEKVKEKLGQNKETTIRDEVAQDRINRNPPDDRTIIITGSGEVLCYDVLTDRYFRSTVEDIKKAQNEVNLEIATHDSVPLSRFYDHIGLMPTPFTENVGWNLDNRCDIELSTVMSKDNQPCISVDFARLPKSDYDAVYHP